MLKTAAWTVLSILAFSPLSSTAQGPHNSFAGCYTTLGLPTGPDDISITPAPTFTRENCQAYCISQSTSAKTYYLSHLSQDNNLSTACTCSVRSIARDFRAGGQANYQCGSGSVSSSYLQSSFDIVACTGTTISPGLRLVGAVTDTRQCFVLCGTEINADWVRQSGTGTIYNCYCGTVSGSVMAVNCIQGSHQLYARSAGAAASGFARRAKARREAEASVGRKKPCPGGMRACLIQGQGDAYECINIEAELESCGGCLYGEHGGSEAEGGIDCTTIQGIDRNAVTCHQGQCRAFACEQGHYLQGDACMPL